MTWNTRLMLLCLALPVVVVAAAFHVGRAVAQGAADGEPTVTASGGNVPVADGSGQSVEERIKALETRLADVQTQVRPIAVFDALTVFKQDKKYAAESLKVREESKKEAAALRERLLPQMENVKKALATTTPGSDDWRKYVHQLVELRLEEQRIESDVMTKFSERGDSIGLDAHARLTTAVSVVCKRVGCDIALNIRLNSEDADKRSFVQHKVIQEAVFWYDTDKIKDVTKDVATEMNKDFKEAPKEGEEEKKDGGEKKSE